MLISTDAVFDGARGHYSEADAPNPTSVYGRTKLEGEQLALASTDALVARTNFFGWSPTGRRSILEFFVNALSNGEQVRGFTDFTTSSAYVQVLAEALWDLCALEATGLVHLTSPEALTKYEFGVAVAEEFGLDAGLITPTTSDMQPPREGDISLDVARAESWLGRRPAEPARGDRPCRGGRAHAATVRRARLRQLDSRHDRRRRRGPGPLNVSVVVPVYRGEDTLPALIEELAALHEPQVTPAGRPFRVTEVLLVWDRGPGRSDAVIRQLHDQARLGAPGLAVAATSASTPRPSPA